MIKRSFSFILARFLFPVGIALVAIVLPNMIIIPPDTGSRLSPERLQKIINATVSK